MGVTSDLAKFVLDTEYRDLPSEVTSLAKNAATDIIGVTIAGSTDSIADILKYNIKSTAGVEECSAVGIGLKSTCPIAAFSNGILAHVLDYDDQHWHFHGHPSCTAFPAALAAGEKNNASGKEVFTAYALALEIECRIGATLWPSHAQRGFHVTGTIGTFGAVAAAGRLFELNHDQMISAFGIAASQAAGLRANIGTMTKSLHAGKACENGVFAALLARKGFTSTKEAFEGRLGFCRCTSDVENCKSITERIGNEWVMLDPGDHNSGLFFKYYPGAGGGGGSFDALIPFAKEHNISPEEIESIETSTTQYGYDITGRVATTGLEGRFSLPYWIAISFVDRAASLASFTDPMVQRPEVSRLMRKVKITIIDEKDAKGNEQEAGRVFKIKLKDGRMIEPKVVTMKTKKGGLTNPMSREDFKLKYRNCAKLVLSSDIAEESATKVEQLESLNSIRELTELIR